jgi:hypothetical protein
MNKHRETIAEFCSALNMANQQEPASVILIRSVARNSETPQSDVDLLIVGAQKPRADVTPPNFHLHVTTVNEFLTKLRDGDDLAAWSVRFGIPIQDTGIWQQIIGSEEAHTWPNWRKKILHAMRRLILAKALLATGDMQAAWEEALYAASHVARAVLLKLNIFPLARAELISQTRAAGQEKLAETLEILLFGDPDEYVLARSLQYLKKLLVDLDKTEFRRRSLEFRGKPLARARRSE